MTLGPVSFPGSTHRSQEFGPAKTSASGWQLQPAMYAISNLAAYWQPYKNWAFYRNYHNGVDFTGLVGTPLLAMENMKIIHAGLRFVNGEPNGGGLVIGGEIRPGTTLWLSHCDALVADVGDIVRKGQQIARLGRTGSVTGPVVHTTLEVVEFYGGVKRTLLWNPEMHMAGGAFASHQRIQPVYGLPAPAPNTVKYHRVMRSIGWPWIRDNPGGPIMGQATKGQLFTTYRLKKDGPPYADWRNNRPRRDWVEVSYQGRKDWIAKAFLVTERIL